MLQMFVQKNMRDVWHRYWTETSVLGSATSAIYMKLLVQDKESPPQDPIMIVLSLSNKTNRTALLA